MIGDAALTYYGGIVTPALLAVVKALRIVLAVDLTEESQSAESTVVPIHEWLRVLSLRRGIQVFITLT